MSRYVIAHDQFCQAFTRVNNANNKRWGEKAWVQGYSTGADIVTWGVPV